MAVHSAGDSAIMGAVFGGLSRGGVGGGVQFIRVKKYRNIYKNVNV